MTSYWSHMYILMLQHQIIKSSLRQWETLIKVLY